MSPERFATHALPPSGKLDPWHGWFDSVFDTARESSNEGFPLESLVWRLGGFAVSRASSGPIHVSRTKSAIRRSAVDHWVIILGKRGKTFVRTGAALLEVPAGVPFVLSAGDEVVSERRRVDRVQLYLARKSFHEIAPWLDEAQGMMLNTPRGKLLGDYMLLLERHLPDMAPGDVPRLASAVRATVGASIAPSPDRLANAARQINIGLLERVQQAVRKYLRSTSLGPDMLCREVAMSRSRLYRLLESEGGVARYIQSQRLSEGYAVLSDSSNTCPIAVIAEGLCFADASSFSRAFRREFGVSPSELRATALARPTPAEVPKESSREIRLPTSISLPRHPAI
jgi:AraC-like DNA-binding protein